MNFKAWYEAVATVDSGIAPPPTEEDDDDWDCDYIRKRFWNSLYPWIQTSSAANIVRFNIYEYILNRVRPKAHSMIWGPQGDGNPRKIVKAKQGYAVGYLEWRFPMEGRKWDRLVEEQRSVLAKSDLYKVFGEESSGHLLFRGEVLECIVGLCCSIVPNAFLVNMIKLAQSRIKAKFDSWLVERIAIKLGTALPGLKLTPMDVPRGLMQAYHGDVLFQFEQSFKMQF